MSVQAYADQLARPFITSGTSYKETVTLLQDAGKSAVLQQYTPLAKITTGGVTSVAGTNTGDGTCTVLATVEGSNVKPGAYVLECTYAVAHGGIFKLTAPGTGIIAQNLTMRAGAGLATPLVAGGIAFTLTDGATDFAAGDKFTLTVAAGSGKYVPVKANGKDGSQRVAGIYLGDQIAAADIVGGDITLCEVLVGGCCVIDGGKVATDGDYAAGLAIVLPSGKTVKEELAALGIFATTSVNLSEVE